MSYMHDFQVKYLPKIEKCDFIPPERIREACIYRAWTYKEASEKCDIDYREFCSYANGHKDIPNKLILKFVGGFRLPKEFFYQLKWGRVDFKIKQILHLRGVSMTDKEILKLWHEGYARLTLAKIYMQRYNNQVKIIRLDMKSRHVKFITYKEALNRVERILIEEVRRCEK